MGDMNPFANERGIVIDWLVKVLIALVIGGVILYDVGSITVNYVTLDGTANDIAIAAATESSQGDVINQRTVLRDAEELAAEHGVKLIKAEFDVLEGRVHIELRRTASTLIVGRIGPIKSWTKATGTGNASVNN